MNAPGAQQNPIYCMIAGALNVSFDNGITWTAVGGSSSNIPLSDLANQADQTIVGNVSGGSAAPTALSAAQVLTMLGITKITDDRATALTRAQALCGNTLSAIMGTHFSNTGEWATTGTSGGTATLSASARAGVVNLSSGGTANHVAQAVLSGCQVSNSKTDKFYAVFRASLSTGIDSAGDIEFQVVSQSNTIIQIGGRGSSSTANYWCFIRDGGGSTKLSASAGVALDTGVFHTFEIWNDGTNINIAIDGTIVGTTAVSGFASGDACQLTAYANNGATAANRQSNIDYMFIVVAPN